MAEKKTFDLSSIIGQVSNLDTASAAAVALPMEQISANGHNFYNVENVDSLVDSILLDGLQSPLVVSQRSEDDYVIISGHRRFKALQQIRDGGLQIPEGKLFASDINAGKVPCLINHYGSELEAELALIRANSDTRVLTSAEISQQAERVEMLLYELKEQGYEFPGKMRDYVAQACQVSASKLARLKVIREKLIAPYRVEFEAGRINETLAYELAQASAEDQHWLYSAERSLSGDSVAGKVKEIACLKAAQCENGDPCRQARNRWDYSNSRAGMYEYMPCKYDTKCCADCSYMRSCRMLCPDCKALIANELAVEKAKKKAENAKIREEDNRNRDRCRALFDRLHQAMTAAGVDEESACKATGLYYYEGRLRMPDKVTGSSFPICRDNLDQLSSLADALKCSTDFLLCRTAIREPTDLIVKKVNANSAADTWRTDTDYPDGMLIARIYLGTGKAMTSIIYHNKYGFSFAEDGERLKLDIAAWYPVPKYEPEYDEEAKDDE